MKELLKCVPNSETRWRKGTELKKIVEECIELGYTDIISIEEHRKMPSEINYIEVHAQLIVY